MEFYQFFEKIVSYIPADYMQVRRGAQAVLPWLYALFTGATCFLGHFMHKVWNGFFFFGLGFIVPLFVLFALLKPAGAVFWVLVVLCVAIGIACAYYSGKLFRARLFLVTLVMMFISTADAVDALGNGVAILLGLTVGVAAALLSLKYKYITVIVTTAFTGASLFFGMIGGRFGWPHGLTAVLAAVLGVIGLGVQCFVEREKLKTSCEHIKTRAGQVKIGSQKVHAHIQDKKKKGQKSK